jgi:hypothetical protein
MATRFYFGSTGTPPVSPAFDARWAVTVGAVRLPLQRKLLLAAPSTLTDFSISIPVTTTQEILRAQFISDPLPPQTIGGSWSGIVRAVESAATANANCSITIYVVSQDGQTVRGNLFNATVIDTEYATSASTVIEVVTALTSLAIQVGDRIVVEMGDHAINPAATTAIHRYGTSAASDFALTHALTTDLNPWIEFTQDLWAGLPNNYQFVKGGDGLSFSDRIR